MRLCCELLRLLHTYRALALCLLAQVPATLPGTVGSTLTKVDRPTDCLVCVHPCNAAPCAGT